MRTPGAEEWKQLIAEYEQSGMPQKEFVERHQVSFNTFQYWLYRKTKRLRSESGSDQRFLPVELVPSPALSARGTQTESKSSGGVEVELPGLRLRFEAGTSARYVAELVGVLR